MTHLAARTETGRLGIYQLKRYWSQIRYNHALHDEFIINRLLCDALGVTLNQIISFIAINQCRFDELEDWVCVTAGVPNPLTIQRFNADLMGEPCPETIAKHLQTIESMENVFSDDDLEHWHDHGFVILRNAISMQQCEETEALIWKEAGISPDAPENWHQNRLNGIMMEFIQHPLLEQNRHSPRIHKAFSQLWKTSDLWVSADRCGLNLPENQYRKFSGPDLHWDIDFEQPQSFCTQGVLYLTDTDENQGATTVVPGFHHQFLSWLEKLPNGADPQQQDLHALGSRPIAAKAGDMIIWHHALPHGSRSNTSERARVVQYINMSPLRNYSKAMKLTG